MQAAIAIVGAVAVAYAMMREGAKNTLSDAVVIVIVCLGFWALSKYVPVRALVAAAAAQPVVAAAQQQSSATGGGASPVVGDVKAEEARKFEDLKFFNIYAKIRDDVLALDFVREYNDGDFTRLAREMDGFVKLYQRLLTSDNSSPEVRQQIDVLVDKRDEILSIVRSFFVCVPRAANGKQFDAMMRKQLLKLQSVMYHMVKKVQRGMSAKRLSFPRPSGSAQLHMFGVSLPRGESFGRAS